MALDLKEEQQDQKEGVQQHLEGGGPGPDCTDPSQVRYHILNLALLLELACRPAFVQHMLGWQPLDGTSNQHNTVQHSTLQHSTSQYSTAQDSAVQYSTSQHSIVQYSTVQHSTV